MVPENWKARMEMLRHLARLEARDKGPPSVRELGEAVGSELADGLQAPQEVGGGRLRRAEGWKGAGRPAHGERLGGRGGDAANG